jgi:hypothetical protein
MSRTELELPQSKEEILQSIGCSFECPKCDGRNHTPGNVFVRSCDFCNWDGSVSFATLLAYGAPEWYVRRLFLTIGSAIHLKTDKGFRDAEKLISLIDRSRKAATDKNLAEGNPFLTDKTLQDLGTIRKKFYARRKEIYDRGMEAAREATRVKMAERVEQTEDACNLRRAAREAQDKNEGYFDQPY